VLRRYLVDFNHIFLTLIGWSRDSAACHPAKDEIKHIFFRKRALILRRDVLHPVWFLCHKRFRKM
jgi:hypothetical protein